MSFYDTAMCALDAKDFDSISELMHEDFIWMDGYDVKTLDEWLVGLKSWSVHWFEVQGQWTTRSCHSRSAASSSLRIGSGGIGIGLKDIVIGLALSLQACRC